MSERLQRRLVLRSSGQVAMAELVLGLWATLGGLSGFYVAALVGSGGLDAGQLVKYLSLMVFT